MIILLLLALDKFFFGVDVEIADHLYKPDKRRSSDHFSEIDESVHALILPPNVTG